MFPTWILDHLKLAGSGDVATVGCRRFERSCPHPCTNNPKYESCRSVNVGKSVTSPSILIRATSEILLRYYIFPKMFTCLVWCLCLVCLLGHPAPDDRTGWRGLSFFSWRRRVKTSIHWFPLHFRMVFPMVSFQRVEEKEERQGEREEGGREREGGVRGRDRACQQYPSQSDHVVPFVESFRVARSLPKKKAVPLGFPRPTPSGPSTQLQPQDVSADSQ